MLLTVQVRHAGTLEERTGNAGGMSTQLSRKGVAMALDYCAVHHQRWDRDWHTECPQCASRRTFENDLQDVSELASEAMSDVATGAWVRQDRNAHLWDEAERLTARLSTALQTLKTHFETPDEDKPEPPMTRPVMGAWNGKSI